MKQLLNSLLNLARECGLVVLALGARLLRWLPTAGWPRIFAFCLLSVLVLGALPLALLLFIVLLLVKLVIVALVLPARKTALPVEHKDEE